MFIRRDGYQALSLAEIIIAVGILAIAILAIAGMFTHGIVMLGQSRQVTDATNAGQACLERITARGPEGISEGVFDGRVPTPANSDAQFPPQPYPRTEQGYPMVVRATRVGAPVGTIGLTVEIYYSSRSKVTLATYVAI